jgi:hypothetical protein
LNLTKKMIDSTIKPWDSTIENWETKDQVDVENSPSTNWIRHDLSRIGMFEPTITGWWFQT